MVRMMNGLKRLHAWSRPPHNQPNCTPPYPPPTRWLRPNLSSDSVPSLHGDYPVRGHLVNERLEFAQECVHQWVRGSSSGPTRLSVVGYALLLIWPQGEPQKPTRVAVPAGAAPVGGVRQTLAIIPKISTVMR